MSFDKYSIQADWHNDRSPPELLGQRFLDYIEQMTRIREPLNEWFLCDNYNMRWIPLEGEKNIMTEFVIRNKLVCDSGDPADGYCLAASDDDLDNSNQNSVHLSIVAGRRCNNSLSMDVGTYSLQPDYETIQYSLFDKALRAAAAIWPCAWANAFIFNMDYDGKSPAPGVPPFRFSRFHMPWISYLSPPLAHGLAPPHGIITERTSDGGLFMVATEARLDPANPVHMTHSRAMSEILIDRVGDS